MDNSFEPSEKLYRAVYPPEVAHMFWRKDGTVSSAAFADAKGLSVNRGDHRTDAEVAKSMLSRFSGHIISVYIKNCRDVGALVKYPQSRNNPYHSEIHGSESNPTLSKPQRLFLARKAVIVA